MKIQVPAIFYKLFYKSIGNKIMGVMSDCDAYKNYNIAIEKKKQKLENMIGRINYEIDSAATNGNLYTYKEFSSREYLSEQQKILKRHFIEKGYRVKIKDTNNSYDDKKIIISWEHWK